MLSAVRVFIATVALTFSGSPVLVDSASNGDVSLCDIDGPFGTVHMNWAKPASAAVNQGKEWYKLSTQDKAWYGSTKVGVKKTWTSGEMQTIHLRVQHKDKKYSGVLLYAVDAKGNKVGSWDTTDPSGSQRFWTAPKCGGKSAVIHTDANPKDYHHAFTFIPPKAGTGTLKFRALIKQGPANVGNFYWSDTLTLPESKTVQPQKLWFRGNLNQDCNQVCSGNNLICDANKMALISSKEPELIFELVSPDFKCSKFEARCSATVPATGDKRNECYYRDTDKSCQAKKTPLPALACTGKSGSKTDGYRICGCAPKGTKLAVNKCQKVNCKNGGTCNRLNGQCACSSGFTGSFCQNAVPQPTPKPAFSCNDGKKNGKETAIDCGGPDCQKCTKYRMQASKWGKCSKKCGGGTRTRTVKCYDDQRKEAAMKNCDDMRPKLHDTPAKETCNRKECITYKITTRGSKWGRCSKKCGKGWQRRRKNCYAPVRPGSKWGPIVKWWRCGYKWNAKEQFDGRHCNKHPCKGRSWVGTVDENDEDVCSGVCGSEAGKLNEVLACVNEDGSPATPEECAADGEAEPDQTCETEACDTLRTGEWDACEWEECTNQCNGDSASMVGVLQRTVRCIDTSAAEGDPDSAAEDGVAGVIVDEELCDIETKPETELYGCNPEPCTDWNWMTTPWSACDPATGKRTRTSHCHDAEGGNRLEDECPKETRPHQEEECLVGQCPSDIQALLAAKAADLTGASAGSRSAPTLLTAGLAAVLSMAAGVDNKAATGLVFLGALNAVSAHNWLHSPARSGGSGGGKANEAKKCAPKTTSVPHMQVTAGQKFAIEWATGHGGKTSLFYFVMMKSTDESYIPSISTNMLDAYLGAAPSSAKKYGKRWHRTNGHDDKFCDDKCKCTINSLATGKAPSSEIIKRDLPYNPVRYMGKDVGKVRETNVQWNYKQEYVKDDSRAAYKSSSYGKFLAVHRFHNFYHRPKEHDVSMFDLPSGTAAGQYIVYMLWRGYSDCIDVQVVSGTAAVAVPFPTATGQPQWKRVDHCQFRGEQIATNCYEASPGRALPAQVLADCNKLKVDQCGGINVVPVSYPKYVQFKDIPLGVDTRKRNCRGVVSSVQKQKSKSFVAVGVKPRPAAGNSDGGETQGPYDISYDIEDPVFYSTCWVRSEGAAFAGNNKPITDKNVQTMFADNRCIPCSAATANNKQDMIPRWDIINRCEDCTFN